MAPEARTLSMTMAAPEDSLAERALAAWEQVQAMSATQEVQRRAEEQRAYVRQLGEWLTSLGVPVAPEQLTTDHRGRPSATVDDLTFSVGASETGAYDNRLYLHRMCHCCGRPRALVEVGGLTHLGELLASAAPLECSTCRRKREAAEEEVDYEQDRAAAATAAASVLSAAEQALADWRQALADLEQALAEATEAARLLRTLQRTERVALAEHARAVRTALAGQPASEPERVGAYLDRVHSDGQYQAILADLEAQTRRWEQASVAAELARQRCRLAAAVLALHGREAGDA